MTVSDVRDLGTVLSVWAHPDDEAYLCGGIMLLAAEAGARVVCVTATKGELGVTDPERWPPERLAEIREAELEASMAILGVTEHHWLGYPDGDCAAVSLDEGAERIAAYLREVRPDTVLTFAPDGQTGHSDHIAVHHWTAEAVRRTGIGTLHVVVNTPDWIEEFLTQMGELGILMGEPPAAWTGPLSIELELAPEVLERKTQALVAQVSQTEGLRTALGLEKYQRIFRAERYRHHPAIVTGE